LRIHEIDEELGEISLLTEIMNDEYWIEGYPTKFIEVDNGYVLAGGYYEETNDNIHLNGWIMKIDDSYQQEWYTELSYDGEESSTHFLWDVEQTSDGGYVTVGEYYNDADPFRRTWLVKLDACGDLQWQGCEPVGIQDWNIQHSRLELYPNPASDILRLAIPLWRGSGVGIESLSIIDLTGKVVMEMSNIQLRMSNDEVELDVSGVNPGLYSVVLDMSSGQVYISKLVVE
jgi:hypothetical protein